MIKVVFKIWLTKLDIRDFFSIFIKLSVIIVVDRMDGGRKSVTI